MNDLIRLSIERSAEMFGGKGDGIFNGACFSQVIYKFAGLKGQMDGKMVRTILTGRNDIEISSGGSHYKLID